MAKKWMLKRISADYDGIAKKYGISPITARVMRNRGVETDEEIDMFLNGALADMHNPFLMKDMEKAACIILQAIYDKRKIRIVGDYDIDGVCSTAILLKSFKLFGADVSYRLPDRIVDGYGINITMIEEAKNDGVQLIVTCDNGIAAYKEIEHAKNLGIQVVVTDHHEVPFEAVSDSNDVDNCAPAKVYIIPPADAVVDPHQADCVYPYKSICGGMVAYKLIQAMLETKVDADNGLPCINSGIPFKEYLDIKRVAYSEIYDSLVDLAAVATIGDIMPLRDENRVCVKWGLNSLRHTRIPGLSALIDVTELDRDRISAYHIGFILGPCINAIGRLDSAVKALDLLMCDSYDEAIPLAKELKQANDVRKTMMEQKIQEAVEIVETGAEGHDYLSDTVLVIFLKECHESIAGLVASRIKERFYKPVIVLTDAESGAKGSGRSIEGYDMFLELSKIKHLFTKFGGHPMAAGLSMPKENIAEMRELLNEYSKLTEDDLTEKLSIDIDLPINYVSKELIKDLEKLGPYGNGNPGPLFAQKDLKILSRRASKKGNMVFFNLKSGPSGQLPEKILEGKIFADADETFERLAGRDSITIAYSPDINSYRGVETIQVSIKEYI